MGACTSTTSPLPKVIVIGASGYVGKATLSSLVSRHGQKVEIYAGVRSPEKFGFMEGVRVVQADMGDKEALTETLRRGHFDAVYLVVPGHESRTQLALNGIDAVKAAGVKFLLTLSVLTSDTDTIFGRQFAPIEEATKKSGVDCAILRLPLFMDNNYANVTSIQGQSTFYDPRDPTKPHTPIAVADVGKASADILATPSKHTGHTYKLVTPSFTLTDAAKAFGRELGREITVTTVPYPAAKEAFMGMGFPEWQVDGIMELFQSIDAERPETNESDVGDMEKITGEKPMTIDTWVSQNAAAFQS